MRTIPLEPAMVHGAVSFRSQHNAIWPLRFPARDLPLLDPAQRLARQVRVAAGVRVRVRTGTRTLHLRVVATAADRPFDLVIGGQLIQSAKLPAGQEWVAFDPLAGRDQALEVWLPQKSDDPTGLVCLEVDDEASVAPSADDRPRWTTYGSSITQCGAAHSPARTWPAIVARQAGLNLTCLGYGGAEHLEPLVAMTIRDLPTDFISLKVGINVYGSGSLNAITYPAAVIGLVRIIREAHPRVPIAMISSIISPDREAKPNAVGLTLSDYREMTRRAAIALNERGDTNLYYFDGRELLGQEDARFLHDGLHPSGDGYELIADRFLRRVLSRIHVRGTIPAACGSLAGEGASAG